MAQQRPRAARVLVQERRHVVHLAVRDEPQVVGGVVPCHLTPRHTHHVARAPLPTRRIALRNRLRLLSAAHALRQPANVVTVRAGVAHAPPPPPLRRGRHTGRRRVVSSCWRQHGRRSSCLDELLAAALRRVAARARGGHHAVEHVLKRTRLKALRQPHAGIGRVGRLRIVAVARKRARGRHRHQRLHRAHAHHVVGAVHTDRHAINDARRFRRGGRRRAPLRARHRRSDASGGRGGLGALRPQAGRTCRLPAPRGALPAPPAGKRAYSNWFQVFSRK
mmetsp:Transcript_14371/g.49967  ORF Transcript_14371/g.49967 Transcript_14371/m.49967 type:complete len:278 (-) Transcript_14371:247-1080(-)